MKDIKIFLNKNKGAALTAIGVACCVLILLSVIIANCRHEKYLEAQQKQRETEVQNLQNWMKKTIEDDAVAERRMFFESFSRNKIYQDWENFVRFESPNVSDDGWVSGFSEKTVFFEGVVGFDLFPAKENGKKRLNPSKLRSAAYNEDSSDGNFYYFDISVSSRNEIINFLGEPDYKELDSRISYYTSDGKEEFTFYFQHEVLTTVVYSVLYY